MKITVKKMDYDDVCRIVPGRHKKPGKQSPFFRWLMCMLSKSELKSVKHVYKEVDMDRLRADEPCLFLMNHSSFTDLQIAAVYLKNRQYHIVCTNDGFVGKEKLMRRLGCIPARKFITDTSLVKDMKYAFDRLHSSVLMYPEASYSFDGCETPLPESLGKCIRLMKVPVVIMKTEGAFLRDPLYNCLQKRNVNVTTTVKYFLSAEDSEKLTAEEIGSRLSEEFHYDHFKDQSEKKIRVTESFRADGLHRVLYKCPHCLAEGSTEGKGTVLKCNACGEEYELTETGTLENKNGNTVFEYVSDWYKWERECVKQEIMSGSYHMEAQVNIKMLVDMKAVYDVGEGSLSHDCGGFSLTGCNGRLKYNQSPGASYSLYSDYYWYEIGDMVCIGDTRAQYYCFPKDENAITVAKVRLAAEELYKKNRGHLK